MSIGAEIRSRRLARKWSFAKLAKAVGITKGYLWKVEKDRASPTAVTLARIAAALGTTTSTLLGDDAAHTEDVAYWRTRAELAERSLATILSTAQDALAVARSLVAG